MKTTLMAAVLLLGSTCFAHSQGSPGDNPGDTFDWRGAYSAGIEHALSEHWTVRVDYDYLNFGTVGMSGVVSGGGFDGLTMNSSMSLSAHADRFGISYKI